VIGIRLMMGLAGEGEKWVMMMWLIIIMWEKRGSWSGLGENVMHACKRE